MIMQALGSIIGFVWGLLSIPITVDNIQFTTWQFFLFIIFVALIVNFIFGKEGD